MVQAERGRLGLFLLWRGKTVDVRDESSLVLIFTIVVIGLGYGIYQFFKRKDKRPRLQPASLQLGC